MTRWNVLMTTANFVEVEADTPEDAEMEAFKMYKDGEVRPEYPEFVCENEDLIDDDEEEIEK